ncbi:hypothetical protein [Massilia sp. ST3]|uniref:hypothetical protein n=1 Tax=Massilia sp. ST3 TaxID=2824903 RepID=UPI001B81D6E7|nr:hypothetical protein [Massilia sp. ST3]MBQ5946112.1 hypothetical protein [Massilia sp. ST3]
MRHLNLEAAIWSLFTSTEFFEGAARECDVTVEWFGRLATSRKVANFGRNNQIFDTFKTMAADFRRGAELAKFGDYRFIWDTARCVRGDVRGMMEQPLHSWMAEAEYKDFTNIRVGRLSDYARLIKQALVNAMVGAESFYNSDPDYADRRNDDDAFPGDEIVGVYERSFGWHKEPLFRSLPDPLPEYVIDRSIACRTGDEVPWTGVWYPETGLEQHSLTFAVKELQMQPVYRVIKTVEERKRENEGQRFSRPETIAIATVWHPVIPSARQAVTGEDLRAKAGEACPKAGIWQPMDIDKLPRSYQAGEKMASLGSAYGLTVWRWIADC